MSVARPDAEVDPLPDVALPRRRRGRSLPAAVLLVEDPFPPLRPLATPDRAANGNGALLPTEPAPVAPLRWLREALVDAGIAVIGEAPVIEGADAGTSAPGGSDTAPSRSPGPPSFAELVAKVAALVTMAADHPHLRANLDPRRLVLAATGRAAAVAMEVAARSPGLPLVLISPVAVELVVRRLDRAAEKGVPTPPSDEERFIRDAGARQPMRLLALAEPRPIAIIHPAAELRAGEHAEAVATALRLDGRVVERVAVAFAGRSLAEPHARAAVTAALARFVQGA
ncbi:MAG TPA: hypothetical protein PKC43_11840 [Phycisphaerales bacterium]|nr:hypothetical protein [Phycisphaerales bacterium]HMP38123.1 hypothetical protein [Phycisphaerales bacterium]